MAADTALKRYAAIQAAMPWMGVGYPDTASALARAANLKLFALEAASSDGIPDAFSFSDQAGVALGATITSAAVTITGIDTTVSFTATDGTIDVNEDGNFQTSRDVVNNDTIRARHTSSGSYLTATHTTVTGGGVSDIFTSTTLGDPASTAYLFSPFSFSWWRF